MQAPHLIAEQVSIKQRIEMYGQYFERVAQMLTQLCIKSDNPASGLATERIVAVGSLQ